MAVAAEALITVTDDEVVKTCKAGHPLTPDNLVWDASARSGKKYSRCRQCKHESVRRWRANNTPAANRSMIVPKKGKLTGKTVVDADNPYAMRRLWLLFDKPLRDRLAAVVLDERVDVLQRRVIERVIDTRSWAATPPDVATRLFVERLLDALIDSRSASLRVDVMMSLIWSR